MGILYLISTPIGNLEDITLRAAKTLFEVDLILCEDTRRTGRLLEWLQSCGDLRDFSEVRRPELLSYTDYTREKRMDEVLARLARGQKIALVSNAGTPLLSDPGFKLVQRVIELSKDFAVRVESLPGANAVLPAMQLSGFPPDKFLFLGFLPKKSGKRRKLIENLALILGNIKLTVVCFESPYRLLESLEDIRDVLGDIQIAVCRELTKMHEEVFRGPVSEAINHFGSKRVKGEVTIVLT